MRNEEIIIIVVLIFFILFLLNNNHHKENYNELLVDSQNNNQICSDKNKLYQNLTTKVPTISSFLTDNNFIKENDNLCMCPMDYNPIDCNGKMYDNDCSARCAGEDLSMCSRNSNNINYFIDEESNNNLDMLYVL